MQTPWRTKIFVLFIVISCALHTESNKYLLTGWHAVTFYVCISMAGHINSLFITPDTTFKLVKATQFVAYQSILSWSFSWPLSNANAKGKGKDSLPIFICLLFIMDFWFIALCFCDMILMYSAQIDGWFSILYYNSLASCLTHFSPHWYVTRAPPLVTTVLVSHLKIPPKM